MPSVKEKIRRNIEKGNHLKRWEIEFKSTHSLKFEIAPFYTPDATRFRVGTRDGIFSCDSKNYIIIGITNNEPGNGHLDDVFEWFENSFKRDKRNLIVAELMNKRFMKHLIDKRGFVVIDDDNVMKYIK